MLCSAELLPIFRERSITVATNPQAAPQARKWAPTSDTERYIPVDVLRGAALFGVLLVNLMGAFRISLFDHIVGLHEESSPAALIINTAIAVLVEFKAFALFSLLFGAGAAIQAERAARRGIAVSTFLVRRFAVLFGIGIAHLFLVWNGDILALYGVCGLILTPFASASARTLCVAGAASLILPYVVPLPIAWPSQQEMRIQAIQAARVYAEAGFAEILSFRCHEAIRFILPLLFASLPRTLGLMFLGAAAWRSGILRDRGALKRILLTAGALAAVSTVVHWSPLRNSATEAVTDLTSNIPLALAYAAAILLWLTPSRLPRVRALATTGQMALTNYLMQSVVLSLIFYGYGLGLFGKLSPAAGVLIAVMVFVAQMAASAWWLTRFRFGPFEWLWRSLTYGHLQQLRRTG